MALEVGSGAEPVAGYRLIEMLGQGGYGQVWKAAAPGDVHVALKFIRLDTGQAAPELRALQSIREIRHPHLLDTHFSLQVDDCLIIATGLCDQNLWQRYSDCRDQGLPGIPFDELRQYMDEAAVALDFLNGPPHHVQHRDIKPQNIFLVGGSVKLGDFGLAKALEGTQASHTGSMTPAYAAPETFNGTVSPTGDQFSLAMTYCHLRTGSLPFPGNPQQMMYGILHGEPQLDGLTDAEQSVVARALSKQPSDRWPHCREFTAALRSRVPVAAQGESTPASDVRNETLQGPSGVAPIGELPTNTARAYETHPQADPAAAQRQPIIWDGGRSARSPSRRRLWTALAGLCALAASVVIFIQTDHGEIKIDLADPQAVSVVRIDDHAVRIDALDKPLRLRAGRHLLHVEGDGFETLSRSFMVKRGDNPVYAVQFTPTPALGEHTDADPPPPEPPVKLTVPLANDSAVEPVAPAASTPVSLPAVYTITVDPPEAELSVDPRVGKLEGAGARQTLTITQPEDHGPLHVTAKLDGYESLSRELTPAAGVSASLSFRLTAKPAVFDLRLTPETAAIRVQAGDGKLLGTGDGRQLLQAAPDGKRSVTVVVSHEGFETARQTLVGKPGGRELVAIRLESIVPPLFDATRARTPDGAQSAQQAWARHLGGPVIERNNALDMELVLIPPGEYLRGSPNSDPQASISEKPQHRVRLTQAFYIGKTEVTQGQWQQVMGTRPWQGQFYVKEGQDYPATYVSWGDAVAFCTKLTEQERRAGRLPASWEYTLPTEAQWEYACRAGTTTKYHFGDDDSQLGLYAWFEKNADDVDAKYAHEVGRKWANAWGLFDMHGNIWEWCADWYDATYYRQLQSQTAIDPLGPPNGSLRVYRGGSWSVTARGCRSANRYGYSSSYQIDSLGFRVAQVPSSR